MKKTGIEFEKFVYQLYKKLVRNPNYETVQHNVKLKGIDGLRQIDVLLSNKSFGVNYLTVIECKDYKSKLSIDKIDEFHSKLIDVKANKGILISTNGFSKMSISKAERLGITLCTAKQADQQDWNPEIDFPILAVELTPIDCNYYFQITSSNKGEIKFTNDNSINGINIHDYVDESWINGKLKIEKKSDLQKIDVIQIKSPYFIANGNGKYTQIYSPEVYIKLKVRYFVSNLSKIKDVQILNNITNGIKTFSLKIPSLKETQSEFRLINKKEAAKFIGISYDIRVLPTSNFKLNQLTIQKA